MQRVNVVGTSGSGKSTFGRRLADALGIDYVEMDALYWKPEWQEPSDEEFFPKLRSALEGPRWVLDGNYSRTTPIKWERVDTVVWLDFGFMRTLSQIVVRSLRRAFSKQELWPGTGNRESLRRTFASHDSVVLWMMTSRRKVRRRYAAMMEDPSYAHIRFVRLRTRAEAERFLESAGATSSTL